MREGFPLYSLDVRGRERFALSQAITEAKRAKRKFVVVDIGANVGLFSFFVAAYG
jgi:hypothetical protein